jgi:hypothetical protein
VLELGLQSPAQSEGKTYALLFVKTAEECNCAAACPADETATQQ